LFICSDYGLVKSGRILEQEHGGGPYYF